MYPLEEFIMTKQFTRSFDHLRKSGLNPTQAAIMDQLLDRMESSIKRSKYYDKDEKSHFIIFTCEQLATQLNLSPRSISRAYLSLENNGWIKRKAVKGVTFAHIFLPNFTPNAFPYFINRHLDLSDKLSGTHWTICHLNQTLVIQTVKQSVNTVNTTASELQRKNSNQSSKPSQAPKNSQPISAIDAWKDATVNKLGFPAMAVEQITKFVKNNVNAAKAIVKKILIARGTVVKDNQLKKGALTQFESNGNIQGRLAGTLARIFGYIERKHYSSYFGYLVKSCKGFFAEAFGLKPDVPMETPKIPKAKWQNKDVYQETLPDWAKDGYVAPKTNPIAQAEKAQVNQELARLALNKIMVNQPDYLKSFPDNDMVDIYSRLKNDLGEIKPEVLIPAVKLVQANFGQMTINSIKAPAASDDQSATVTEHSETLSVDKAEVAQVNRELAQLALHKMMRKQPNYLAEFQQTDLDSIQRKLKNDLHQPKPSILQQAVQQIKEQLTRKERPWA